MALRDYYVALGVTHGATPDEIRSAYREHAKALHPDHAGEGGTVPFQELSEAYSTLSDPVRRREYDEAMAAERGAGSPIRVSPVNPAHEAFSILHGNARYHPSLDAIREHFFRNFTGVGVPKGERAEGLNIEVVLSSEEAFRGILLPIEVPTLDVCHACGGTGRDWGFPCSVCRGEGSVEWERTVGLRIPPGVRPGSLFEIPLDHLAIRNFYLKVHVFVDDRLAQAD
jgi:DnaJ-class molecular chaperone